MHKRLNGTVNEDVSGKFTTSTDKQEGGVWMCVCGCVSCIPIGSTEHDEVTAW